ncbi:MAG: DNA-binding protein [Devosia sp.]|uniref:helix-turn-helix domain-containing protein n=1 Tax=Devosia sp. TaxID=1871048 RepID=UPI002639A2B5|nr:transcriptional regulator [Devosia sp.]MDB5540258.1 DNA-binding protein [Devosia sp.]
MTKSAFDQIAAGMNDAIAYADGATVGYETHVPAEVNLRAIRRHLQLSQPEFARKFGFSVGRIRDWEQHRTPIDASSRVLLTVIEREPEAVKRALSVRVAR